MQIQLTQVLKLLTILLVTIFIVGGAVQVLATDSYLAFEYDKSSFPSDPFGYTQQQRFILASTNIHYVRDHLPGDELSKQFLNGLPVYNPREVSHMADVQAVFQTVLRVWKAALILLILLSFILWKKGERKALASAIQSGGVVTFGLILSIALLALVSWQIWFDLFHRFFFEEGSWLFDYSDTLIRLFPLRFWSDATFAITAFSLAGGLWMTLIGWLGKRVLAGNQI
jgi:integral membrane protein (TIGR01906 family)